MKSYTYSKKHNLILLNFPKIFLKIEKQFLNDCIKYSLFNENKLKLNKDVKQIFYHNVIFGLCEEIKLNRKKGKKVYLTHENVVSESNEIVQYCPISQINLVLNDILCKIQKKIPIIVYFSDLSIDFTEIFNKYLLKGGGGELTDLLYLVEATIDSSNNRKFTYKGIKSLSNKYNLTFLSESYFNDIKSKQLLVNLL